MTERYALVGEDVSRSLSPVMMNSAFKERGVDAVYETVSVPPDTFPYRIKDLLASTSGMNITIPFKSQVIEYLDELDSVSSRIGAVNVVKRTGTKASGYNTDVNGIVASLREHGRERVRSALLVGAGGAARAFCEAMDELGCPEVLVVVRDPSRGESFISEMSGVFKGIRFGFSTLDRLRDVDVDLVFNATPIGSGGRELPEPLKRVIYGRSTVFDAVYRPTKTELLKTAELRGCTTISGYEMLLNQGVLAFEIWTGKSAPKEVMRQSLVRSLQSEADGS